MSLSNSMMAHEMTVGSVTNRGDEDILHNIMNFVSTNMPNLKIDKYSSTD